MITHKDLIKRIEQLVVKVGSRYETAQRLGVTDTYLKDVLSGARTPGRKIPAYFGYEPITVYEEKKRSRRKKAR